MKSDKQLKKNILSITHTKGVLEGIIMVKDLLAHVIEKKKEDGMPEEITRKDLPEIIKLSEDYINSKLKPKRDLIIKP